MKTEIWESSITMLKTMASKGDVEAQDALDAVAKAQENEQLKIGKGK
ncbi:MAG: hypothetical protein HRT88_22070 [Lentisphaeraceae bacterium]|nr:hypothetical protein [Lentisphaeraceae bacterium]